MTERQDPSRVGFFTDTSVCIGCKACEVACKEWNQIPEDGLNLTGMSYDNTEGLGADTWRHVAFIEQPDRSADVDLRWLMSSDVCKTPHAMRQAAGPLAAGSPAAEVSDAQLASQAFAAVHLDTPVMPDGDAGQTLACRD